MTESTPRAENQAPEAVLAFFGSLPPGPLRRVTDSSGAGEDLTVAAGRRTEVLPLQDFLAAEGTGGTPIEPGAALVFELEQRPVAPLSLLQRAQSALPTNGAILVRRWNAQPCRAAGPKRDAEDYFAMLAAHFGFLPASAPDTGCLALRKKGHPRWQISLPAADSTECRALFARVFGTGIAPEFWHWKYGNGRGRALVARRGDELIAHYGGTTRRVLFNGTEVQALQVCDVMVAPQERAVMTRRGAFFEVASAWLETYFGYFNEHLLAFGFPNRRAMQIGAKLGLYAEVARIAELNWLPLPPRSGIATTARLLDPQDDHTMLFQHLWKQMRADLDGRIAVIRDAEYLRYRYLDNPQFRYDLVAVRHRLSRRPCALVVLRREAEFCRLLDFVGPISEIPRAIAHVRRLVGAWGLPRLTGWISSRDAELFVAAGAQSTNTDVCVPINNWSEGPSAAEVRERWWLMMGDTEFL